MRNYLLIARFFIEYIFVRFFFIIINLLPINISKKCVAFFFKLFGKFSKKNKIAIANCKYIFPLSERKKINQIINLSWENLGNTFSELTRLNEVMNQDNNFQLIGMENINNIIQKKTQAIFFSIHHSNWEICVPMLDKLGIEIGAIYRHINNFFIDKFIYKKRTHALFSNKSFYTPKGRKSAKDIIEGIKNKKSIFLLIDQKDTAGQDIKFFDKIVKTQIGFLKIARKYNIPIIPIENSRINNKFILKFHKPIFNNNKKINDEEIMLNIHQIIEQWIKANPTQWLWQHNRFN
ncbi:MAG: hypothetical protein CMI96_03330 [Pelagibacteraceae bacterium]|nr:hypothetical protein [Pelagibacteraceae bacterium]|tara:strand:- start:16225 stop:17100 length:876 start_codon:yes stop_codon:yes gene_type:complete